MENNKHFSSNLEKDKSEKYDSEKYDSEEYEKKVDQIIKIIIDADPEGAVESHLAKPKQP